jgi:hypothetical protein
MFSTLRTRFGIPGVISVIALVFAMFGGAYAASNSSGGGKATASAKAKQGPRGKTGKTGPAGPAGPAGPQGPAGAKGDAGTAGTNGTNGTNGTDGTNGESVTISTLAAGSIECAEGGAKFSNKTGTAHACNGAAGSGGGGGSLPTALGPEETEAGTFTFQGLGTPEENAPVVHAPISFPIPLSEADTENITHHFAAEEGDATCSGNIEVPTAPPGLICFYVSSASTVVNGFEVTSPAGVFNGVGTSGVVLTAEEKHFSQFAFGSFAITAPEAP